MVRAIYFGLCWGLAMFGLLVLTQISFWLGISVFILFIIKFLLMKEGLI